jgi:hypothetical protein
LTLLLFAALALGQDAEVALEVPAGVEVSFPSDDPETGPLVVEDPSLLTLRAPPTLADGINLVPAGSLVLLRGDDGAFESKLVVGKSFLMPEVMYDNARLKARQLDICQPALDEVTEETLRMADKTYTALSKCSEQFDADEELVADLSSQLQSMETRALVAEDRLKQAKRNSMVAWAITGGILFGGSAAIVLSVAN